MKLLPSLKQKKRYIVFEIISKSIFSSKDIEESILKGLKSFLGEFGLAKAKPLFLLNKTKNNKFMLKVNSDSVDLIKSALTLIKTIKNEPVIIKSITTSGTIKKASLYLGDNKNETTNDR